MIRFPTDATRCVRGHTIRFLTRLLVAAYLIEAGLILVIGPWTALWDRNYFSLTIPWVRTLMAAHLIRGLVTIVGLVTVVAGLSDLRAAFLPLFPGSATDSGDAAGRS